jgi:Fe2+ transport system protein FeoA
MPTNNPPAASVAPISTADSSPVITDRAPVAPLDNVANLPLGATGRVHKLNLEMGLGDRLEIMGICPGRMIKVIRKGDPMVVKVLDTHFGLAKDLAQHIMVECLDGTSSTSSTTSSTTSNPVGVSS